MQAHQEQSPYLKYTYPKPTSESGYKETAPGRYDFIRGLNKQDAYLASHPHSSETNSSIFIDLNENDVQGDQRIIVEEQVYQRLSEGFDCYIYQDKTFKKIDLADLKKRDLFNGGIKSNKIEFEQALAEFSLSADQVLFVDKDNVRQFMNGREEDADAHFHTAAIDLEGSNLSIETLNALLKQRQSVITSLNLSGCLNLGNGDLSAALQFPRLNRFILGESRKNLLRERYNSRRETTLSSTSIYRLIAASPELTELDLSGYNNYNAKIHLDCEDIPHPEKLEVLKLSHYTSCDEDILQELTCIKVLHYIEEKATSELFSKLFPQINFSLVEELGLSVNKMDSKDLFKNTKLTSLKALILTGSLSASSLENLIAHNAPNLEVLDLSKCKIIGDITTALSFPSLKTLRLSGRISAKVLSNFISQSENLEHLSFSNYDDGNADYEPSEIKGEILKPLPLHSLKTFESAGNISAASLENLILHATKLEELNVSGWGRMSGEITKVLPLHSLKKLHLRSEISSISLFNLIKHASALEELDLSSCPEILEEIEMPLSLPSLKKFHVRDINARSLINLITHPERLEELECNLTGEITKELPLHSLKKLTLHGKISAASLTNLIVHAKALEELNLYDCEITGEITKALPLHSLKKLTLINTISTSEKRINLSAESFENLISQTKRLTNLDLSSCKITGEIRKGLPLHSLINLQLTGNLSAISLENLLSQAKNLESLSISNCEMRGEPLLRSLAIHAVALETLTLSDFQMTDEITQIFSLHSLKTLSLVEKSKISARSLINLIAGAPLLEELKISGCEISGEITEPLKMKVLKKLTVQGEISATSLINFIIGAPALETLDLSYCTITGGVKAKALLKDILAQLKQEGTKVIDPQPHRPYGAGAGTGADPSNKPNNTPEPENAEPTAHHSSLNTQCSSDISATPDPTKQFHRKRIFYPYPGCEKPNIWLDRLRIDDKIIEISGTQITLGHHSNYLNLKPCPTFKGKSLKRCQESTYQYLTQPDEKYNYYYADQQTLTLTEEWQALPSRSPHETMTHWHLDKQVDVEIEYCARDNCYCIRLTPDKKKPQLLESKEEVRSKEVNIDFVIAVPKPKPCALPKDIQDKIAEYAAFDEKDVEVEKGDDLSEEGYFNLQEKQRVGKCITRAAFLKRYIDSEKVQKRYPGIRARIPSNPGHSFGEIGYKKPGATEEEWTTHNLGGYQAVEKITEKEFDAPPEAKEKKQYFKPPAPSAPPASTEAYIESLLSNPHQNQCVFLPDTASIKSLGIALESHLRSKNKAFLHVRSSDDLVCSAGFIARDEKDMGTFQEGPGGPTHATLMQNQDNEFVLIWDLSRSKPGDVVRNNTQLDKPPSIDGTPLPKNTKVIVLMNPDAPNAYLGQDFLSRLDEKPTYFPLPTEALPSLLTVQTEVEELKERDDKHEDPVLNSDTIPYEINLFNAADWERRLIGEWVPMGSQLQFVKGELIVALEECRLKNKKPHIILDNAPWTNPAFSDFMQDILQHGIVKTRELGEYTIPRDSCVQRNGYAWNKLADWVTPLSSADLQEEKHSSDTFCTALPPNTLVLNTTSLSTFLSRYTVDGEKMLRFEMGLLKAHHEQHPTDPLPIYVSAAFNDDHAWAEFLSACKNEKVQIQLILAPGVEIPPSLSVELKQELPTLSPQIQVFESKGLPQSDLFIESTDPDVTVDQLQLEDEDEKLICIDISDLEPYQLFKKIHHTLYDGCDLHFMTELPVTRLKKYKNSYLLIGKDLYYIGDDDIAKEVEITDPDFVKKMENLNKLAEEKIHLSFKQIKAFITDQGGHSPEHNKLDMRFEEQEGVLDTLLNANKTVVITGNPKAEMLDELNTFIVQRQNEDKFEKGKLIILSEKQNLVSALPTAKHTVSIAEKKEALLCRQPQLTASFMPEEKEAEINPSAQHASDIFSDSEYQTLSLLHLEAMLISHAVHGDKNKAWEGMEQLDRPYRITDEDLAKLDRTDADRALAKRDKLLEDAFQQGNRNFAFIIGESGTGKTTTILKRFFKQLGKDGLPRKHWVGKDKIAQWAEDQSPGEKYLLLDEFNADGKNWTEFEGLRRNPPVVVVGNTCITLTPNHKVFFVGNPRSNGGTRNDPHILKRHGNTTVIDPLEPCVLYQDKLKPILECLLHVNVVEDLEEKLADESEVLAQQLFGDFSPVEASSKSKPKEKQKHVVDRALFDEIPIPPIALEVKETPPPTLDIKALSRSTFLKSLQFLTNISPGKSLMSPRELTAMALYTVSYCRRNPTADPKIVARYYAYTIAKPLVPSEHRAAFEALWGEVSKLPRPPVGYPKDRKKSVLITTSNRAAWDAINDALDLRELRLAHPELAALHEPGLENVILEGEAGLGKSELILQALEMRGYIKRDVHSEIEIPEETLRAKKYFYVISANMPVDKIKELEIRAFHEGVPIVTDEMNTGPALEPLRNELSMGTYLGKPAKEAGFLRAGSRNPPTQKGRQRPSNASQRRTREVGMPHYQKPETLNVLRHKGLFIGSTTTEMVDDYFEQREKAANEENPLCPRDLIKCANREHDDFVSRPAAYGKQRFFAGNVVSDQVNALGFQDVEARENPLLVAVSANQQAAEIEKEKEFVVLKAPKLRMDVVEASGGEDDEWVLCGFKGREESVFL